MFQSKVFYFLLITIYSQVLVNQGTPVLPYEHAIRTNAAQNHELQKGSSAFDQASKKGVNSEQAASGFAEDNAKKFENAQAEGHFNQDNSVKKAHEEAGNYADENFHKVQGGSLADVGKKISHKKGHHKSGYHNSYHKDESGGNSSFYDDANDEGDEQLYKSNRGLYGNSGQKSQHGSHLDGSVQSNDAAQRGGYNRGNNYGTEHADSKKYNQGQYYNDQNQQSVSNMGNQFGEHGNQQEQVYKAQVPVGGLGYGGYNNYYHQPVPVQPVPVPVPVPAKPVIYPDSKITIYEDPRYGYEKGAYYDDHRIDYRPAGQYYYGRQQHPASYDYYYY